MKTTMFKRLCAVLLSVTFLLSAFSVAVSAAKVTNSVPMLLDPYIIPVYMRGGYYVGICDEILPDDATFYLEFDTDGRDAWIAVKHLFGEPAPSDNENGDMLIPYQQWDDDTSVRLKKSWLKECSGDWLKVYIQANNKSCHFYIRVGSDDIPESPVPCVDSIGSASSLKITWNAVSGAEKYQIARSLSKRDDYTVVATVSGTSWIDNHLEPDTKYYYILNAVSASGRESGWGMYDYNWTEEQTVPVISESALKMVEIARNELGYCEGKTNLTKFGKYTGTDGYAWCASFVSWCANQAGLSGKWKPFKCGTYANPLSILNGGVGWYFYDTYMVNGKDWISQNSAPGKKFDYFMENLSETIWDPDRSLCQPQEGDLIFFKKSDGSPWAHVGIVSGFDPWTRQLTYIDGNGTYADNNAELLYGKSGHTCVSEWKVSFDDTKTIMAIVRPEYN